MTSAAAPWLARGQHPAIFRAHIRCLWLVAWKAERHDGTRRQVANFFHALNMGDGGLIHIKKQDISIVWVK